MCTQFRYGCGGVGWALARPVLTAAKGKGSGVAHCPQLWHVLPHRCHEIVVVVVVGVVGVGGGSPRGPSLKT